MAGNNLQIDPQTKKDTFLFGSKLIWKDKIFALGAVAGDVKSDWQRALR